MDNTTRRAFLSTAAVITASASSISLSGMSKEKKQLVHHVYFWMTNPDSKEDMEKLLAGVRSLGKIDSLRMFRIGKPAPTEKRDVIDDSYQISLLTVFDDIQGHDAYQEHPIHLKFIETCKHLWTKVTVYDSIDI